MNTQSFIQVVKAFALSSALALVGASHAVAQGAADLPAKPPALSEKKTRSEEDTRIPGRYIVVLKGSVEHPGDVAEAQAENRDGELGFVYRHSIKGYSVADLSKADVEALRENPKVKYVAPDRELELFSQTIPAGIERVYATDNATADIDGQNDAPVNVDVAVIDTGIDFEHPDLNVVARTDCTVPEGASYKCVNGQGTDLNGHGTHVAGTIAAIDNGEGVVGVAPGARLHAVKVVTDGGSTKAFESSAIAGVDWVKSHASEIEAANVSLGCYCPLPSLEAAVSAAASAGVAFAIAAGNESLTAEGVSPGKNPDVITVSALADYDGAPGADAAPMKAAKCTEEDASGELSYGADDTFAWFSNWGSLVEVAAPGVCVLSTVPGGKYAHASGTSMASPHVAGAAALLASKSNPNSKADVEALRKQIVDEGNQSWTDIWTSGDIESGFGQEGSFDSIQEPLLDVAGTGPTTYATRATQREAQSAVLNGGVNPKGTATTYQFEYGTSESYGTTVPASPKSAGSGSKHLKFSESIAGLKTNTTYHYRLISKTSGGTTFGADQTFRVRQTFNTHTPTEVEASSATFKGSINPAGLSTTYQFEYVDAAEHQANGWANAVKAPSTPKSAGSGTKQVIASHNVTGLKSQTTYHYRLTITNKDGTFVDNSHRTFTTPKAMITAPATAIGAHSARLEGSIDPSGKATSYQFEWGTSPEYGNKVPVSPKSIGSGFQAIRVGERLEGLKANKTYHYRLAAVTAEGTTFDEGRTFKTTSTGFLPEGSGSGSFSTVDPGFFQIETRWGIFANPFGFGKIFCAESGLEGESKGPAESWSAILEVNQCHGGWSDQEASVSTGCEFELYPGVALVEPKGAYKGSLSIGGPYCKELRIVLPDNFPELNEPLCDISLPAQAGLITEFTEEDGTITVRLSGGKLRYTQTGSACTDGTFSEGILTGEWEVSGFTEDGEPIPISIVDAFKVAPTVHTKAPSDIGKAQATLHGTVNPNLLETTYQFQYVEEWEFFEQLEEEDPQYSTGGVVPASPVSIGSGAKDVAVEQTVSGLTPGTNYVFWLKASNSEGLANGGGDDFTTDPPVWSLQSTPNPDPPDESSLADVSCASTSACLAVGNDSYKGQGLAEFWNGAEWKLFNGSFDRPLSAVSCGSATKCFALGTKADASAFSQRWSSSGESWLKSEATPATPEGGSAVALKEIACSSNFTCTAVGTYSKEGKARTLAERYDEGTNTWSVQATATTAANSELLDVACPSASECIAVGLRESNQPLAERWNGSSWSTMSTPLPAEATAGKLTDISCSSASSCVVTGRSSKGFSISPLALHWNGTSWSLTSTGLTAGSAAEPVDVSCASSSSCIAIGLKEGKTQMQAWNGSEWSAQTSPNPAGKTPSLGGISCVSSGSCAAVGSATSGGESVTLGLRYE